MVCGGGRGNDPLAISIHSACGAVWVSFMNVRMTFLLFLLLERRFTTIRLQITNFLRLEIPWGLWNLLAG